jgi:hypothetical protein
MGQRYSDFRVPTGSKSDRNMIKVSRAGRMI